jgi:hypothetical protein
VNILTIEKFDELLVSSKEVDEPNINISVEKINEIIELYEFIKFGKSKPILISNLPEELQNVDVYNNILYEMYIEDFLDNYIVNRFNSNKYLKIKYKVINDYNKLYNIIEDLKRNIDLLEKFIFTQNSNSDIINLNNKINEIEVTEFNDFFNNDIKNYLDKVFINLGLNEFFVFDLLELNNDNIVYIMDTLDSVIENESNLYNNYLEN